ncbi:hypothetical protein H9P43_001354 [Blastocladiella emersonii ATCC 22665]|nr:hypothetical protein H9P43_001354 [Blastocladiella emersonii ATCC 22665]
MDGNDDHRNNSNQNDAAERKRLLDPNVDPARRTAKARFADGPRAAESASAAPSPAPDARPRSIGARRLGGATYHAINDPTLTGAGYARRRMAVPWAWVRGCGYTVAAAVALTVLTSLVAYAVLRPASLLDLDLGGGGGGAVPRASIDWVHVHAWTPDGDPVANVDTTIYLDHLQQDPQKRAAWRRVAGLLQGRVLVEATDFQIYLRNPLPPVPHPADAPVVDGKVYHGTARLAHFGPRPPLARRETPCPDCHHGPHHGAAQRHRVADMVIADALADSPPPSNGSDDDGENGDDGDDDDSPGLWIGTATVPAFHPLVSRGDPQFSAHLEDTTVALDPDLVESWLPPFLQRAKDAPRMQLRFVGSPMVVLGSRPLHVRRALRDLAVDIDVDVAAVFREDYHLKVPDFSFQPGSLAFDAGLWCASGLDEYVAHLNVTLKNPLPVTAEIPLAATVPVFDPADPLDADPLVRVVGDWADPGLVIPSGRARVPLTIHIPATQLPRVFQLVRDYEAGKPVTVRIGPGSAMEPVTPFAPVLARLQEVTTVQKESKGTGAARRRHRGVVDMHKVMAAVRDALMVRAVVDEAEL